MNDEVILVFVNDRPVRIGSGQTISEAVVSADADLGRQLTEGEAYVTDGVGRIVSPTQPAHPGNIIRVIKGTPRSTDVEAEP